MPEDGVNLQSNDKLLTDDDAERTSTLKAIKWLSKIVKEDKSTYKTDLFNFNNKRVSFTIKRYRPDAKQVDLQVKYEGKEDLDFFYCKAIKSKDMSGVLIIKRVE